MGVHSLFVCFNSRSENLAFFCLFFFQIGNQRIKMGTPGSGRKRTPVKDRFSAEDEALSSIAREVC